MVTANKEPTQTVRTRLERLFKTCFTLVSENSVTLTLSRSFFSKTSSNISYVYICAGTIVVALFGRLSSSCTKISNC